MSQVLKKPYLYWSIVLISMLLKYLYYGFKYFPVVDDNNMYGVYSLMSPLDAFLKFEMYTTRPFAVILDTFFISRLWDNLEIVLVLMILLHFATAFLLYKVFEKNNMKIGILLILFFVLNPLGTDAAYWISASSRIVVGLFFAALSMYLIMLLCGMKQKSILKTVLIMAGYFLASLMSFGFYEQVTAIGFVFSILLILANLKKSQRLVMLGVTLVNIVLTGYYYYYFRGTGNTADRGQLVDTEFWKHTGIVIEKFWSLLSVNFLSMLKHGVINGFNIIMQDGSWLYLLAILLTSAAFAVIYAKEEIRENWKRVVLRLVAGIVIVFVSYAPFFILNVIWISNRNTFISYIGVGLMVEALLNLVFRALKGKWPIYLKGFLFGIVIVAFMITNIAEVYDYRKVNAVDREIVNNLTEQYKGMENEKGKVFVFNTRAQYFQMTGKHLSTSSGVYWAFTGAAKAISRGRVNYDKVIPLKDRVKTAVDLDVLRSSPLFGLQEDLSVCRLSLVVESDSSFVLVQENGEKFGELEIVSDGVAVFTRFIAE